MKTYGLALEDGSAGNGQTEWSPFTGGTGWTYTDKNPWGTHYNYDQAKFQDTMTWYRSFITKGYMPSQDKVIGVGHRRPTRRPATTPWPSRVTGTPRPTPHSRASRSGSRRCR